MYDFCVAFVRDILIYFKIFKLLFFGRWIYQLYIVVYTGKEQLRQTLMA